MERTERIALQHGLLTRNRYGLSNDRLMREAECSRSTLYRDLSFMRDTLGAPLEPAPLMDIQRYSAGAESIAPAGMREQLRGMLAAALGRYG